MRTKNGLRSHRTAGHRRPAKTGRQLVALLLLAGLLLVACDSGGGEAAVSELAQQLTADAVEAQQPQDVQPTQVPAEEASPLPEEQAPTTEPPPEQPATEQPVEQPTVEPPPADTAQPTPDQALLTAAETATALFLELDATRVAAEATNTASEMATEAALQPILQELASLGVDPNAGRLAWQHPPLTLEVTDFEDYAFDNLFLLTPARDFVLVADVTWNSRFAESGCGFVFRSDGEEEALNQYIMGMTRGAQGHVLFAEQVDGEVDLNEVTDIYADGIDPNFEWQSDTTNRMAVVGRGQDFTLFSNGTRLGSVQGTRGFEDGFVAFMAVNRSGGIRCDYNNAYLWKFD